MCGYVKNELLHDREWLEQKYHVEGLSQREIAEIAGCDASSVSRAMKRENIESREAKRTIEYPELHDPEWVREKYVEEFMTSLEIAEMLGCGKSHSLRAVKEHVPEDEIRTPGAQGNILDSRLSEDTREIIEGELLGDGCIRNRHDTPTSAFCYNCSKGGYRNWLYRLLQNEGFKVRTGNRYDKKRTQYNIETKQYRCLRELYDRWYPGGTKTVPEDLELTSVRLRQWYIGDGTRTDSGLRIYAYNFEGEQLERLADQLGEKGIETTTNKGVLRIRDKWRGEFFDYMAPLPPEIESVYGYKWPDNG